MTDLWALLREAQAKVRALEAETARWREDSLRQAATINRLAAAAEDRNEVDVIKHKLLEAAEATLARVEALRRYDVADYEGGGMRPYSEGDWINADELQAALKGEA